MERIILHIDVNNAFLSWHAIKMLKSGYKKDIRNLVAVIGGSEENRTGIVLAKSMPVKKLGIKTGDSLYSARRICPNILVFHPDFSFYQEMSNKLFSLLLTFSPDIEIASIDECYMDYSKVKSLYGDEKEFAYMLKDKIKKELGFTVNIGIGNNKLCAKMASDFSKPDKVHTLYLNEISSKMYPLSIDDLFGVGKSTSKKLKMLNINTIGDLANFPINSLNKIFKNKANYLINIANGIDDSIVNTMSDNRKGISNEITLSEDVNNINILNEYIFILSQYLSERLCKANKYAYVICVILKTSSFVRKNHQKRLKNPINSTADIYTFSKELLKEFYNGEDIRLVGIRLDDLVDDLNYQTSIFDENDVVDRKIDQVILDINNKLGKDIVKRASYIDLKR